MPKNGVAIVIAITHAIDPYILYKIAGITMNMRHYTENDMTKATEAEVTIEIMAETMAATTAEVMVTAGIKPIN